MPELAAPRVSVLLPVYNARRFLAGTLGAIQAQTLRDFEILVVNDGSTDGSAALLDEFARAEPRCRVLHQANAGLVAALNRGLEQCRAPLIARIDADDLMHPQRLEFQQALMQKYPEIGLLGSAFQDFADEGQLRSSGSLEPTPDLEELERVDRQTLLGGRLIGHPTVMIRKQKLRQIGGYRKQFPHAEDYDCWLRLQETAEIYLMPQALTFRRIHGDNVSRSYFGAQRFAADIARQCAVSRDAAQPEPLPLQDIEASIGRVRIKQKLLAKFAGERLSEYLGANQFSKASQLLLRVVRHQPLSVPWALRYAMRHGMTGTVRKSWEPRVSGVSAS